MALRRGATIPLCSFSCLTGTVATQSAPILPQIAPSTGLMSRLLAALLAVLVLGQPAAAEDTALQPLSDGVAQRGWGGVGRLQIAGKGFCTAALISDTEVLTAAHCLFDEDGSLISTDRMHFAAGYREGRAMALRDVRRSAPHPAFRYDRANENERGLGHDIALIELEAPIRGTQVTPFSIASAPLRGHDVGVVSYAVEREEAPSLQEICGVRETHEQAMILSCDVDFGASGAPVFSLASGEARIVGVVTAKAHVGTQQVALSAKAEDSLALLRATLAEAEAGHFNDIPQARVINRGERNSDIAAKFVRP